MAKYLFAALSLILIIGLTGCFKEADDGKAVPTNQEVNLRDIQLQRTQTQAPQATVTATRAVATFTPQLATTVSKTLVIGGPPVEDETEPTATDVPPDVATVAPPGLGDSGISPTPSRTLTLTQSPNLPTPTALATLDECIYVVQGGDTLFSIARSFDLFPEDFYPINPELQYDPDSLSVGQQLRIPNCESEATPTIDSSVTAAPTLPTGNQAYTVQQNDTLFSIAIRFGVTVEDIVNANDFLVSENTTIFPGDVLIIPAPSE